MINKSIQFFICLFFGLILSSCSALKDNTKNSTLANAPKGTTVREDIKNILLNDFSKDQVSSLFNWLQLRGCLVLKVVQSEDYLAQLSCEVEHGSDIQARIFQWADKNNISVQQSNSEGIVFINRVP